METLQKNMQSEDDPVDDRNHLTNMNTTNVKKTNPVIRRLQPGIPRIIKATTNLTMVSKGKGGLTRVYTRKLLKQKQLVLNTPATYLAVGYTFQLPKKPLHSSVLFQQQVNFFLKQYPNNPNRF
jgi:hypothetical protein